ncbi:putative protein kinase UbiB [compost metagenome]
MTKNRLLELGSMTTQVAAKELENLTLGLFSSPDEKRKRNEDTQAKIAEIIFSKLSNLKGTGLKLLQALSLDEDLLPQPYVKKFEQTYGSISPLSKPIVKKVFKIEVGSAPEDVFAEFDYNAMAAASLGQVHKAKLKTGEDVIVKIQYPNVAENISTDLAFIQSIAKAVGNPLIRSTITELSVSLRSEIDYNLEAENLKLFSSLEKPEGIVIPHLYPEFSTQKVLVLSRIEGEPLNTVSTQSLRDLALQRTFKFFFMSLSKGRCVHADPHPGNILVSNGHTGVVDFGSVKKDLPQEVVELFLLLCDSGADTNRIVEIYESLGAKIPNGTNEFYAKHVQTYHQLCSSLVGKESVDFSTQRETVAKMRRTLFAQSSESTLQNFSSEFTILHKSFQSLLFLLCKYQATINTKVPGQ